MPVVNYHSVNGRLIGETTNGVRTDYMTDALGSVTGTLNSSQAVVNTYRYKPFGDLLAKTGTGADPKFMWNGGTQSRKTGLAFSEQYHRARHYGTRQGQWTTVDPLVVYLVQLKVTPTTHMVLASYSFAFSAPVSYSDSSGLSPDSGFSEVGPAPLPTRSCINGSIPLDKFFPHPIFQIFRPSLKFSYCQTCYYCGCPDSCTAQRCEKLSAGFCLTFDPKEVAGQVTWGSLLGFADDFRRSADVIGNVITGMVGNSVICLLPSKGCPEKRSSVGAEVTASFCNLGFEMFARGAYEYVTPCRSPAHFHGHFEAGVRFSNCGIVKLEVCAGMFLENCA